MSNDDDQEYLKAYNSVVQSKIPLFTKPIFFPYFKKIITHTLMSSSLSKEPRIFIKQKSSKYKPNHWYAFTKMFATTNKQYSTCEIIVRFLTLRAKWILHKIIKIALANQADVLLLLKAYLYLSETTMELKYAAKTFRNLVNLPKAYAHALSQQSLIKLAKTDNKNNKQKDREVDEPKLKIYYRYNVITPFIHHNRINPIDSVALTQRLMENYELIRFQRIHFKNLEKIENAKYDPLTKKKKIIFKKKLRPDCWSSRNRSLNISPTKKNNQQQKKNDSYNQGKPKTLLFSMKNNSDSMNQLSSSRDISTWRDSTKMALYSTRSKSTANLLKGDHSSNNNNNTTSDQQFKMSSSSSNNNNIKTNSKSTIVNKNNFRRSNSIITSYSTKSQLKNYFLKKDLYY